MRVTMETDGDDFPENMLRLARALGLKLSDLEASTMTAAGPWRQASLLGDTLDCPTCGPPGG